MFLWKLEPVDLRAEIWTKGWEAKTFLVRAENESKAREFVISIVPAPKSAGPRRPKLPNPWVFYQKKDEPHKTTCKMISSDEAGYPLEGEPGVIFSKPIKSTD